MKSMTGYGLGEASDQNSEISVEIKAVNHRYFDCHIRLPWNMSAYDHQLRNLLKQHILRGKLEVSVSKTDKPTTENTVCIDRQKVQCYYQACSQIAAEINMTMPNLVMAIADKPGVINTDNSDLDYWPVLSEAALVACDQLNAIRLREGEAIVADLLQKVAKMQDLVDEIVEIAPTVPETYRQRLSERLPNLLSGQLEEVYPDQRLFAEVAIFAERCCIDEELVRLNDHLAKLRDILQADESRGKTLDFLAQELVREVNTIGSKANSLEITNRVLQLKELIEQYREQIQNLE